MVHRFSTKGLRPFSEERIVFSIMVLGQTGIPMPKTEFGPNFTPHTNITSTWIRDLSVRAKIITLLDENTGVNICGLGFISDFLDIHQMHEGQKKK